MVLAPLSDWRAAIGTTFIIDIWFTGIIIAGLLASAFLYRSRWPSVAATAMLVAYVGFQLDQRQHSFAFADQYAKTRGLSGAQVTAHQRPVAPFNWTVFVSIAH